MRWIEKQVLLQTLDVRWREHLSQLDHLRSVIHLRGYGQRDPLNEYKNEAFALFGRMLFDLRTTVTTQLMLLQIEAPEEQQGAAAGQTIEVHADPRTGENEMAPPLAAAFPRATPGGFDQTNPATWGKISRNAQCPCGSGKKYKHCHGDVAAGAGAASA
jgi:preprotein translocase subunit SecA